MASSNDYYRLYEQKMTAVTTFDNRINDLRGILSNLTDNMYDEIRAINNELDYLKSDLNKAVRHNATFTRCANSLESKKEKAVTADASLRTVCDDLQEEITRVSNQKNQAISDREYYYSQYVVKKEEEHQIWLDQLLKGELK
ncbi:MAG: hypothetical protein RR846_09610 [Oscillospiraceae bacterium]